MIPTTARTTFACVLGVLLAPAVAAHAQFDAASQFNALSQRLHASVPSAMPGAAAPPTAGSAAPAAPRGDAPLPHPVITGATSVVIPGVGHDMDGDFSSASPEEKKLHITLGRSFFISTKHRLSRVFIANPEVLDSYTASPNQVVLTAKKTGTTTLIVWDEVGDTQVYFVYSDVDVDSLRDSLKAAMPNDNVEVRANEGRIQLVGTLGSDSRSDAALKLAQLYSKDVSNAIVVNSSKVKQVRLHVKILEVSRSKAAQFGINIFSSNGSTGINTTTGQYPNSITSTLGNNSTSVTASNPVNFTVFSSRFNIGATIQDLQTKSAVQILAEPTITTMSDQKGSFLAGGEFPYPVVQSTSTGTSVSISFRPYGVKLDFTPHVNQDNSIELAVSPEVSALDYTNAVTISGYTTPALSTRRANTQVVLRSGQSFAIGGLLDNRTTDSYQRTPGIASIPIIGELFKSKSLNHTNSELVVIVTPELVDPLTDTTEPKEPVLASVPLNTKQFDAKMPADSKHQ